MTRLTALAFVALLASGHRARAELTEAELRYELGQDLGKLALNLPTWLGQHLTAVLAPIGGSGTSISEQFGTFKLGVSARVALFNNVDDLAKDLAVLEFPEALPALLPWAGVGGTVGLGLGHGLELDADVVFVPPIRLGDEELRLQTAKLSTALTLRWRLNAPCGLRPSIVLGLGLGYTTGGLVTTSSFVEFYDDTAFDRAITGRVRIATFSKVTYDLTQLMPELRIAWCLSVFRPYFGLGLGISHGHLTDDVRFRAVATLDTIDGYAAYEDPIVEESRVVRLEVNPSLLTVRPFAGFDLDFGPFALTAQVDLAMTGETRITGTFSDALGSFDLAAPNLLFQDGARRARSQATLQGSVALRTSF